MSRGRKRKSIDLGSLIALIIILSVTKNIWGGLLSSLVGGLFALIGSLAIFIAIIALISVVLGKLSKGDSARDNRNAKPTKNPYSTNYSEEAVKEAEKFSKQVEIVVNGKTVKSTKPQAEAKPAPEPAPAPEPKHRTTGDPEIDKMIVDKDLAIEEMKRLDEAIIDEKLSEQIVHLEAVTEKIVDYIVAHPKKKNQVSKFFSYYLPTTLKLLNAYDRMDDTGISGTNIDGTKDKVEDMMETALSAFDKQLDALFADEALDVTTDIKVMENMLKAEGLTDDNITLTL